jgi:flagellar hook assembly protein FlgD
MSDSPASAINAEVRVEVAGRTLIEEATLGEKNSIKFKWDGKDALGNRVQGAVDAKVKAVYYYKLVYYSATDEFELI